jgi:hypothetical protein
MDCYLPLGIGMPLKTLCYSIVLVLLYNSQCQSLILLPITSTRLGQTHDR